MAVLATEHENEFCWDLWRPWLPNTLANQRPSIDEVSDPDTFNFVPWAAEDEEWTGLLQTPQPVPCRYTKHGPPPYV